MKRFAFITAAVFAGAAFGAVLMLATQGISATNQAASDATAPAPTDLGPSTSNPADAGSPPVTTPQTEAVESPPISDQVLLVWTPGNLPTGLAERVAALPGVTAVTTVRSDLVHLTGTQNSAGDILDQPPDGFVIPLEVMAFDPNTYPAFLLKQESGTFTKLGSGQIILGKTSAQLRRLGLGGVLMFENGSRFTVVAIVDDVLIGAAEAALPLGDGADSLAVEAERYLLIRYSGTRKGLESSIRADLPEGVAVRIRAPGETPVLRHGDAVLPQILIKKHFGEFAYRPAQDLTFVIEPDWVEANIITSNVPLLGQVTCHRNLLPALVRAMEELEERNLAFLVDPSGFRGCFNPRYIANRKGISRHAWGAAIDINIGSNPEGLESIQDPRLIEIMERSGLISGDEWLIPDPGHFEYVQLAHQE